MKIYKIIDTDDENNRQVGEMYTRIQTAKKTVQVMMKNHCLKVALKMNKMTGIKRGANVQKFNDLIEVVEVNDSWR
jgi:hypothetical protein